MFLAFQYPQEIPGVSVIQFLRQALSARKGIDLSVLELRLATMEWMKRLGMDSSFVDRYLNEGFSGGEKKRNEIMQMAILEPELAILDETDSGLDIDALRTVAKGIREIRSRPPEDGRRADHPLPAPARRGAARPRAHPGRRPHRRQRRHGAGRASWSATATRRSGGADEPRQLATIPSEFPIFEREIDGLPIVYLDSANTSQKPQSGHRRDDATSWRRRTRRSTAAPTSSPPRPPTRTRAPARKVAAVHQRAEGRRGDLHQERHRGAQPGRVQSGAAPTCSDGDVVVLTAHGAPRQHRAVAHARRRARHRAALGAAHRRRPARPHRSPTPARRRQGVLRSRR